MVNDRTSVFCTFCGNGSRGDNPKDYRAYVLGLDKHPKGIWYKCFRCKTSIHAEQYYKRIGEDYHTETDTNINLELLTYVKPKEVIIKKKRVEHNFNVFTKEEMIYYNNATNDNSNLLNIFLKKRMIPKNKHHFFTYSENFMQLYYNINKINKKFYFPDKRILIKYLDYKGDIYALKGRSLLQKPKLKYLTIKKELPPELTFFNMDGIDINQPIFILEGEIDSIFFDNNIALGSISKTDLFLEYCINNEIPKKNLYFILDNDEAGYETSNELILNGYHVFSWKLFAKSNFNIILIKDVNELIQNNIDFNSEIVLRNSINTPTESFLL